MPYCLTIAICTRNHASLLGCALDRVVEQWWPRREQCELLVVDNGSSDETPQMLFAATERWGLRYVHEAHAGLSYARNTAVRSASGAWVMFTDDDMRWEKGWLEGWLDAARSFADAGWMGGAVRTHWVATKPRWLKDDSLAFLEGVLGRHELRRDGGRYLPGDPWPIGGNFGVRRDVFERVGPFRVDLGHSGEQRGLGEETEWFLRASALGFVGVYVPRALALHPIEPQRLRLRSLYRHGVASGVAQVRMNPLRDRGTLLRAGWSLVRGARQACMGRGDRFRQCVVNAGIEMGARLEQRAQGRCVSPRS